MKIVSVWNPKGGQGKSLLSINLAAAACELDFKPMVVCDDPQGTSTLFYKGGNLPFEVVSALPDERPDADIVIIDHSAKDWEVPPAPIVVMPTKPDRSDIATFQDAMAMMKPTGKRVIPVVIDGNMHRESQVRAVMALKRVGAFEFKSSGVYSRASEEWRSIFDRELNGAYKINERRAEFQSLLSAVLATQQQEEAA